MGVSGSSNFLSVYSENFALKGRVGDDHPRTREAVPIARACPPERPASVQFLFN